MGVKSLWKLLTPVGRPVLLETLEGKVLAIDSSIWIYQFQATMRDNDGRVISNAHVLGFLRRICKLLFWGIKPVFVFDGGAPALKRSTINERRRKKEGAATAHAKVAERLLAAQMRREAIDHAQGRGPLSKSKSTASTNRAEDDDEEAVYFEDLDPSMPVGKPRSRAKPQSSTKPRFYDHDPYHLPDMNFESKVAETSRSALDPRLATDEEMRSFISEMAPSDFDLTSEAFCSLPTEVQYEIIGDLRLRSRQTSFKRLQNMLKNSETSLDFSKQQIKGLKERNRLTQQLLTTTDSVGKAHVEIPIRIAGERNREYVLVKNEGEGKGWILGMRDVGTRDQPIIVDDPSRDGVKPKEAREKQGEEVESDDNMEMENVQVSVFDGFREASQLISTSSRLTEQPPATAAVPQDQDLQRYQSRMSLAAVAKRQKKSSRSSPTKTRSGIFPRRASGPRPEAKTAEVPLFVPEEEDDAIPQVVGESEGDEWEDFDEELEEDVQMSIAITRSLESQYQSMRIPNTRPQTQAPILETPTKTPRQTDMDDHDKAVTHDVDEFASPSRLATQLSIAGARKPASTRIPSDSVPRTAPFVTSTPSVSPMKSAQTLLMMPPLDRPPSSPSQGATGGEGESDEDDDMEEVSIPQVTENYLSAPTTEPALEPTVNAGPTPAIDGAETPLAIAVEDVVAKRFAEFQEVFAEKRMTLKAEKPEVQGEIRKAREVLRVESPGLEYADDQVEVIEIQEKGKETTEMKSSPPAQSDEDEDMEEVEVLAASPSVSSLIPRTSAQSEPSFQPPPPSIPAVTGTLPPKRLEESADGEDEEDVPISDWSRSPSPRPRPQVGEADISTFAPTLDHSRGLLDPDDSFDQRPSGERDREHEDFDAAHEMDPDAEAGEFARWMSQVKGQNLDDVRKEIEQEINGLRKEKKAVMRDSEDITGQMIAQIMMMLRLFGIPYITAPMEAEAQCAELVHLGLVEGIITDDSDVFLFGGNRVFRNMFNQSKTVECFLSSDLVRELGLDRGTLVRLAYLLGSDYTEGVAGVGPVVAMELVKEFPGEDGLEKFAEWWRKVQNGRDKKDESASKFRKSFKKKFMKLYIGEDWPNPAVRDAYYHPTVDSSEEPFKWGLPDLDGLRGILREELGWNQQKSDELLLPVIQRVTKRGVAAAANKQSNLDTYFGDSIARVGGSAIPRKRQSYTSKRLQKVVTDYREEQKKHSRGTAKRGSSTLSGPHRSAGQHVEEKDADEYLLADFGEESDVSGSGDDWERDPKLGPVTRTGKTSKPTTAAPTQKRAAGEKRRARKTSKNTTSTARRSTKRKKRTNDSDEYDDDDGYADADEIVPVAARPRPKPVRKRPNTNSGAGSNTADQERDA